MDHFIIQKSECVSLSKRNGSSKITESGMGAKIQQRVILTKLSSMQYQRVLWKSVEDSKILHGPSNTTMFGCRSEGAPVS